MIEQPTPAEAITVSPPRPYVRVPSVLTSLERAESLPPAMSWVEPTAPSF